MLPKSFHLDLGHWRYQNVVVLLDIVKYDVEQCYV